MNKPTDTFWFFSSDGQVEGAEVLASFDENGCLDIHIDARSMDSEEQFLSDVMRNLKNTSLKHRLKCNDYQSFRTYCRFKTTNFDRTFTFLHNGRVCIKRPMGTEYHGNGDDAWYETIENINGHILRAYSHRTSYRHHTVHMELDGKRLKTKKDYAEAEELLNEKEVFSTTEET